MTPAESDPPVDNAADAPAADTPRALADRFVAAAVSLNPLIATSLGLPEGADRWPDLSPDGAAAEADLERRTVAELDALIERSGGLGALPGPERRCARLLRERLLASLALHEADEPLRAVGTLASPLQAIRTALTLMPAESPEDWQTIGARISAVPQALAGYQRSLAEGLSRGLLAGPSQVTAVIEQLGHWLGEPVAQVRPGAGSGAGAGAAPADWFSGFAAAAPPELADGLAAASTAAASAVHDLRRWLQTDYLPAAATGSDAVGEERYRRWARYWTGADLDLAEAYSWAWAEYARIDAEIHEEADRVLPGATPQAAMAHLEEHGPAIEGVEAIRERLQQMLDEAIDALDGAHFDLAEPVRRVEAMIAPAGSAAAPYYTAPSMDFSRPGRTWLPTLGRTRFPLWDLVSTWYHEGVPGHHLQLAQWVLIAPQLSRYQSSLGEIGANVEGWALYAERLMDELGFFTEPGARLGFLDAQQLRAIRVVIDIGMHLELPIPADQHGREPFHPGERWTPALAREFLGRNSGRPGDFLDSEIIRYLGLPGQAIGYKLGERAWLAGREQARAASVARGEPFEAKRWHMAALSLGSLGLDDLVAELAAA